MIDPEATICEVCRKEVRWETFDLHMENEHMTKTYTTKDSGVRESFDSGMVRDTQAGKPRYDLCWKPLYRRWAELMARGAEKYGDNNWMKATGNAELTRFYASAERHLQQWLNGETDEDHAAAVIFNLAGAEYVKQRRSHESKESGIIVVSPNTCPTPDDVGPYTRSNVNPHFHCDDSNTR